MSAANSTTAPQTVAIEVYVLVDEAGDHVTVNVDVPCTEQPATVSVS